MSRSRGYCFVVNNYTDDDIAQLMWLTESCFVSYMVVGFENAPTTGTPHLQGYMHFDNGKTMSVVCKEVPRISLQEAKAQGENYDRRYTYCMKDGDYWEYGIRPLDGKNTGTEKVITAIKEGKTYDELVDLFPSYMIHHGPKVKRFMSDRMPSVKTKFMVVEPKMLVDAIDHIRLSLKLVTMDDYAIVTDLSQLEVYKKYKHVIYYPDTFERLHLLWARGAPISYKYGYEQRLVKCIDFIIVTSDAKRYAPYYKKI